MKPLTSGERWLVNKAFQSVRARPQQVYDAYWDDRVRMLRVRKVAGKRYLKIPSYVVHVGRYDASATWEQIIDDLNATLDYNSGEAK